MAFQLEMLLITVIIASCKVCLECIYVSGDEVAGAYDPQ